MISGILYEKRSSANKEAVLLFSNELIIIKINDITVYEGVLSSLVISSRLGNIDRRITLNDGRIFLTQENDRVDKILFKTNKSKIFLYLLESNLLFILLSLLCTVLFSFSFFKYGIPYLSKKIAYSLPLSVNNVISENTLSILDKYILDESLLSDKKKDEVIKSFETKLLPILENNDKFKYKIHFRLWKIDKKSSGVANAFALPNGDIIFTDKLINLSTNIDEINAVLLHEIGHIEQRHGLQRLLHNSFIAVVIMLISGDNSSFVDMGLGLGSLFINSNYSRNHESQADLFAFRKMLIAKIDPNNFSTIMSKISSDFDKIPNKKTKKNITDYFSSHPPTDSRIKIAKKYSDCFKNGLISCESK